MKNVKLLKIFNLILEKKELPKVDNLKPEMSLRDDFEFDSLDLAELTVRIEDTFGVDIFAKGIVTTVKEIMDQLS